MKLVLFAFVLICGFGANVASAAGLRCSYLDQRGQRQMLELETEKSSGLLLKVAFQLQGHAYPDVYFLEAIERGPSYSVYRCHRASEKGAYRAVPCDTLRLEGEGTIRTLTVSAPGRLPYIASLDLLACR
jgi:hypothetical protein